MNFQIKSQYHGIKAQIFGAFIPHASYYMFVSQVKAKVGRRMNLPSREDDDEEDEDDYGKSLTLNFFLSFFFYSVSS